MLLGFQASVALPSFVDGAWRGKQASGWKRKMQVSVPVDFRGERDASASRASDIHGPDRLRCTFLHAMLTL